jgi:hypothetical protein
MSPLANETKFDDALPTGHREITANQRSQIMYCFLGIVRNGIFKTDVIEEAINNGTFLEYGLNTSWPDKSALHVELETTLDYIRELNQIIEMPGNPSWSEGLMSQVSSNNDREQACYVKSFDLAMACTFHNRSANVFNSHLALCKVLMGMEDSLPSYNRLPQTFRGEDQDQRIRAERVNSTEIETLIRNSISPFGGRQIIGSNGDSEDDRVKKYKTCSVIDFQI